MKRRFIIALSLAMLIAGLDQLAKAWIQASIPLYETRPVIDGFFNLVHTLNRGAVFGFLNNPDTAWPRYFFIVVTFLAMGLIAHLLSAAREGGKLLPVALGLVLGGAVGNLIDRIRYGHVVDFLDFYVGSLHWPAFNVADSAISVGACLLIISFYRRRRP